MELQEIKHKSCPMCKSRIVYIEQKSKHCNGHWNESIKFFCGSIIRFSPNFMREEIDTPCPHDPVEMEKKRKRTLATKKLEKYIARLDVDEEFKRYINVHGLRIY